MWYTFFLSVTFITNLDLYIHACIPSTPHPCPELVVKHVAALLNLPVQAGFGRRLLWGTSSVPAKLRFLLREGPVLRQELSFLPPGALPRSAVWLSQWGILQGAGRPPPCLLHTFASFCQITRCETCLSTGKKRDRWLGFRAPKPSESCSPCPSKGLVSRQNHGFAFLGFLFCFCFFYFSKKRFFVCDLQSSPLGPPATHIRSWTLPRPAGL